MLLGLPPRLEFDFILMGVWIAVVLAICVIGLVMFLR